MTDVPFAHDDAPGETLVLLQRTQAVVDSVFTQYHAQDDIHPTTVEAALREKIALAGLPEQPAPWVRNTADEIAAGRRPVLDTRTE
jgi:hypothetical protein